jgi:hypothetical protein
MKLMLLPAALLSALALVPALATDTSLQEVPLEKRVQELEHQVQELQVAVRAGQGQMENIAGWFAALPKTAAKLDAGMEEAGRKGFAWAGANIDAKEEVLRTLRAFATTFGRDPLASPQQSGTGPKRER